MKNNKLINEKKRIIIVGGGAAGMAASIGASRNAGDFVEIVCLERNDGLGKKLMATGNGRCNLSNAGCKDVAMVRDFFSSLGILIRREDEGRLYPHSEQASSVRDALHEEMRRLNVRLILGEKVRAMEKTENHDSVEKKLRVCMESGEKMDADAVILAAGGKAGPQYGCEGDGYRIAKAFGHNIISPRPALVQFVVDEKYKEKMAALKGVRAKAKLGLYKNEKLLGEEGGEVQFTGYGLSGICVFNLSRIYAEESRQHHEEVFSVSVDFAPEYDFNSVESLLAEKRSAGANGIINGKAALALTAGISETEAARAIKESRFKISGTKGWKEAQVTSGGVDISEIDVKSMGSKLVPGLYFAGEVLNYDGPCGGYNLNWAFSTGLKAGIGATKC